MINRRDRVGVLGGVHGGGVHGGGVPCAPEAAVDCGYCGSDRLVDSVT